MQPQDPPTVAASPREIRPLLVGEKIPAVTVKAVDGSPFDLAAGAANKPAVIVFYRGGWCPYCNTQLGGLAQIEGRIIGLGYQVLAVSPDRPEKLRESIAKHNMKYTLLSDSDMAAARAFGIAFTVDAATIEKYRGYRIDLEDASGRKHHMLPVPSVFVVGTDGVIVFEYVNPDYKIRIDPDALLSALKAAQKKEAGVPKK